MDIIYRMKNAHKAVAWKQGKIWVQVYPPYDEASIFYSIEVPDKINVVNNPTKGWEKITKLGGQVASDAYDEFASWFDEESESDIIIGEQKTKLALK